MAPKQPSNTAELTKHFVANQRCSAYVSGMKDTWPHLAVLLLASLLLYAQVLGFGFLNFDDDVYLYNTIVDQWTQQPWSDRLLTPYLGYPLAVPVALYAALKEVVGLHAPSFHALNLIMHGANAGLLWGILRSLTKNPWAATLGAAAWAFHPALAESVSWITSLKEVSVTFGCLLCIFAFERYRLSSRKGWLGLALLAAVWAIFSKPTGIVLGPVLIVIAVVLHRNETKQFFRSMLSGGAATLFLAAGLAVVAYTSHLEHEGQGAGFSLDRVIAAAAIQIQNYVVPLNFNPVYFFDGVPTEAWFFVPGVTLILAGTAYHFRSTIPLIAVGVLWLLITYAPTSNLVFLGRFTAVSYAYLPTVGAAFAVAGIIDANYDSRPNRALLLPFILACLVGSWLAFKESRNWSESAVLWSTEVNKRPNNHFARLKLGQGLYAQGEYEAAIHEFNKIPPELLGRNLNFPVRWGLSYCRLGDKQRCAHLLIAATKSAHAYASSGIGKRGAMYTTMVLGQAYREFDLDPTLLPPGLRGSLKDAMVITLP